MIADEETLPGIAPSPRRRGETVSEIARSLSFGWVCVALGQAFSLAALLVVLKLVASLGTASMFGAFALVMAVAGAASMLVFGPLGQWASRHYQEAREAGALRGYYLAATVAIGVGTALLAVAAVPLFVADRVLAQLDLTRTLVCLGLAIGIAGGVSDVCVVVANAAMRRGLAAFLLFTASALRPVAIVVAWVLGGKTITVWAGSIAAVSAAFLVVEVALLFRMDRPRTRSGQLDGLGQLRPLWRYTLPFFVWGLPAYAISFGDRLVLGYVSNTKAVGLYVAMATATMGSANAFGAMLNRVVEPVIFRRAGDGRDALRKRHAHRLVNVSVAVASAFAVLLTLFAWAEPAFVVGLFTSSRYADNVGSLWVLSLAALVFLVGQQLVLHGLVEKRPWVYVPAKFAHAIALILALVLLVPGRGVLGALYAVLLAQCVQLVLVLLSNRVLKGQGAA